MGINVNLVDDLHPSTTGLTIDCYSWNWRGIEHLTYLEFLNMSYLLLHRFEFSDASKLEHLVVRYRGFPEVIGDASVFHLPNIKTIDLYTAHGTLVSNRVLSDPRVRVVYISGKHSGTS